MYKSICAADVQPLFKRIVRRAIELFGLSMLNNVELRVNTTPFYTNRTPDNDLPRYRYGGCWTEGHEIFINPDIVPVMSFYLGIDNPTPKQIEIYLRKIIAHELGHEVYNCCPDDSGVMRLIREAEAKQFSTYYLETVEAHSLPEERFCEYFSYLVTGTDEDEIQKAG